MYQVKIRQSWAGDELLIHSAHANGIKLVNPVVTLDTAAVNTFAFDIYPDNVGYSQLNYLTTLIRVYDTRKHEDVFEGRVLLISDSIDDSTPLHRSVTCEALDAFLNDSISPYLTFKAQRRSQILAALITGHNEQVDTYKQIKLGNVNFGADTVIADCVTDETADTYTNMSSLIMSGFEYRVRNVDGVLYIDVAKTFGEQGTQVIGVNRNLLTATRSIDPSAIVTVLKPMGPASDAATTDTNITPANMNISTVNGGSQYIRDDQLVSQFGEIVRSQSFDTATSPANLFSLGKAYMNSHPFATIQLQVSVVDLAFIRGAPDDLWYGNSYRTLEPQMGIDAYWRISQQTLNLVEPGANTITLGDRVVGQESYNASIATAMAAISRYQGKIKALQASNAQAVAAATSATEAVAALKTQVDALVASGSSTNDDGTTYDPTGLIIDVSEFQGSINWSSVVGAGLALAVIRVQSGSAHEDLTYKTNIPAAINAGANYGVYAYFAALNASDAETEATDFYNRTVAVVGSKRSPKLWMIDVEANSVTSGTLKSAVTAYLNKLNSLGVPDAKIVIYVSNALHDSIDTTRTQIWMPSYGINDGTVANSTKPLHVYDLWQYTSKGVIAGITANTVDMSTEPSDRFKTAFLTK